MSDLGFVWDDRSIDGMVRLVWPDGGVRAATDTEAALIREIERLRRLLRAEGFQWPDEYDPEIVRRGRP